MIPKSRANPIFQMIIDCSSFYSILGLVSIGIFPENLSLGYKQTKKKTDRHTSHFFMCPFKILFLGENQNQAAAGALNDAYGTGPGTVVSSGPWVTVPNGYQPDNNYRANNPFEFGGNSPFG